MVAAQIKCLYKLTESTPLPLSYLNTIVKDFLPDHVTLSSFGDNIKEPVNKKTRKGKKNPTLLFYRCGLCLGREKAHL